MLAECWLGHFLQTFVAGHYCPAGLDHIIDVVPGIKPVEFPGLDFILVLDHHIPDEAGYLFVRPFQLLHRKVCKYELAVKLIRSGTKKMPVGFGQPIYHAKERKQAVKRPVKASFDR